MSGAGEAAERIVKLFNEGNRVHTDVVVTDETSEHLKERLKDEDVTVITVTEGDWVSRKQDIADLLREKDIKLLVLDNFDLMIPDEIMETTEGEMIRVSSPELAPREVVAALEADLRKPVQEEKIEEEEEKEKNPSLESEWADTLKINFTPPRVPTTPPELPHEQKEERIEEPHSDNTSPWSSNPYYNRGREQNTENRLPEEPMPSTYLIWSVLVTVFCCFVPGIIAIIFSSMVSSKYYGGDVEGARRASRNAEIWIIVSVVLGVVAATLYFPFVMMGM